MRLFDLHCDTLCVLSETAGDIVKNTAQVDIVRGKRFAPWYQCFAVWIQDGTPPDTAKQQVARMVSLAEHLEKRHPLQFRIAKSDICAKTPCTALLTIENGGVAAGGDTVPESWITHGIRMVSLTWNGGNRWAEGCAGDASRGLTAAGKRAVRYMERHQMLIDTAHLNERGFWELCELLQTPPVVSHTAAAAVFPSKRGITDAQFAAVRDRDGLVGLDLCGDHLGAQTIDAFIAHLEHFLSLGGEKTVALGGDLDGIDLPSAFNGIEVYAHLYDRLLQRNYAESLVDALFFHNAYRFFKSH